VGGARPGGRVGGGGRRGLSRRAHLVLAGHAGDGGDGLVGVRDARADDHLELTLGLQDPDGLGALLDALPVDLRRVDELEPQAGRAVRDLPDVLGAAHGVDGDASELGVHGASSPGPLHRGPDPARQGAET
jgi:hypothetical protein